MLKRPASLQGRLLLLVLGTALAVWLAAAVATWIDARHELDELLDSHLAQAAALLVAQQAEDLDDDDVVDAPSLHRYAPRVVFQVFHEGRLGLRSAQAPLAPMVTGAQASDGFHTVTLGGERWRVFAARGRESDVQVFVGEQVRSREAILWAVLRSTLWPVAVALPLLALAGWWAVRRGVRPLRVLGRTLAQRRPEALEPVRVADAPAEMLPVLESLNALFARIAILLEGERRFTADAAHELRTPIAAIAAQVQVALAATSDAQRRHALESTLAGCDRAARVVEQLLTLSRLEAEGAALTGQVELGRLVQRVVSELAPASLRRQQSLELHAVPGCVVRGDETLLAVLARNLVDNAIRYSPDGAAIDVRVAREGSTCGLSVADGGPGLPEAGLQRLGDRFFRAAGPERSGSGLGWSIVRRIAAAHAARVDVGRCPTLGGLKVDVRLPAAPVPPLGEDGSRADAGSR